MPDRQDELNSTSDLAPFADALKRLAPQPVHLSRDALLFEAGKASAAPRWSRWTWPSATAIFAGLSFVLAASLLSPSAPSVQYVERVVYVQLPATDPDRSTQVVEKPASPKKAERSSSLESSDAARALQARRDVLRWGIDMLPESKSGGHGPSRDVAARDLTHWLNLPPGTFAIQPRIPAEKEYEIDEEYKP